MTAGIAPARVPSCAGKVSISAPHIIFAGRDAEYVVYHLVAFAVVSILNEEVAAVTVDKGTVEHIVGLVEVNFVTGRHQPILVITNE